MDSRLVAGIETSDPDDIPRRYRRPAWRCGDRLLSAERRRGAAGSIDRASRGISRARRLVGHADAWPAVAFFLAAPLAIRAASGMSDTRSRSLVCARRGLQAGDLRSVGRLLQEGRIRQQSYHGWSKPARPARDARCTSRWSRRPTTSARSIAIAEIARRLAHPQGLTERRGETARARDGKAFVHIDGGLHATEVAGRSAHAAAALRPRSARPSDPDVKAILDNVVADALADDQPRRPADGRASGT